MAEPQREGAPDCAHHWLIQTPDGETSTGVCKICGVTREFANYQGYPATRSSAVWRRAGGRQAKPVSE